MHDQDFVAEGRRVLEVAAGQIVTVPKELLAQLLDELEQFRSGDQVSIHAAEEFMKRFDAVASELADAQARITALKAANTGLGQDLQRTKEIAAVLGELLEQIAQQLGITNGDDETILPALRAALADRMPMEDAAQKLSPAARCQPQTIAKPNQTLATSDDEGPDYWTAGRDADGNIRLCRGQGLLVAEAADTREQIQRWLDLCDHFRPHSRYRRQYLAALDLIDAEEARDVE